jgi:hypothetical protein
VSLLLLPGEVRCQRGEFVPEESSRVRVFAAISPPADGGVLSYILNDNRGRTAARGQFRLAQPLPGPLNAPIDTNHVRVEPGELCLRNESAGEVRLAGNLTPLSPDAVPGTNGPLQRETDEVRVDYFRPGQEQLWRLLPEIARRYDALRPSFVGRWTLPAAFIIFVVGALLAFRLIVGLRHDDPPPLRAMAFTCMAVALLNGISWALLVPTFQGPDEPAHVAYAEFVAQTGHLPGDAFVSSRREAAREAATQHWALFRAVPFNVEGWPTWSPEEDAAFRDRMNNERLAHVDSDAPGTAADSPPLYYLPSAALARVMSRANPIDRIFAMRLTSIVMSCVTALLMILFVRELIPSEPRAWAIGALAVVYQPVFGFLSGTVLNDNLLFAFATALFWLLARTLRLGLTTRRAVAIGAVIALGELAKTRMLLLGPGMALAFVLIFLRAPSIRHKLRAARDTATAAAVAIAIEASWFVISRSVLHRQTGLDRAASTAEATSLAGKLSYTWQFFAPRLPFMSDQFPRWPQFGVWEVYIQGFIGRFGWFQYGFPASVNFAGLLVLLAVGALATSTVLQRWQHASRRWPELLVYPSAFGAVAILVAFSGYTYRASTGYNLEQTRYLFPCLALYAGGLGLASLGAGRRRLPLVGAAVGSLFVAHSFFALVLTVTRYYT